jgi:hypothetical protein
VLQRSYSTAPALERDELWFDRHPALAFCLSMIFSENRIPLFRIMLWIDVARRRRAFVNSREIVALARFRLELEPAR